MRFSTRLLATLLALGEVTRAFPGSIPATPQLEVRQEPELLQNLVGL